ncbi:MAG TPA: 3,4-dihydroxy-2-butanone-4-phosphate synthase [Anaerolineae bacterium]|jgi:3,4-dihydroxy 2-butanone 4-phosphate synthase/GTP cyclohydrolase II
MNQTIFSPIEAALADLQAGKLIIVIDDEDRENEGDLIVAAQFATPAAINFMAGEARGLICTALTGEILDRLAIPMMIPAEQNTSGFGSPFTISVEARTGVTTGISAPDRARTIQVLIDPASAPADIAMPGHMFPLRAHEAGVLGRSGHTEAGVDLTRLAGLMPAAVLCEIMAEDGTMARLPDLQRFAARHDLKLISIEALINYRRQLEGEALVTRVDSAQLPTHYGHFEVTAYRDRQGQEHLLLRLGDLQADPPLVRLHSECLTGDVMGSLRCDCGEQLQIALERIGQDGRGALIYLRQEGRGIGLANKIRAYALQDQGLDTVEANVCLGFPADPRNFAIAAAILRDQEVKAVRLMTNNLRKVADLETNQIEVVERVAHQVKARSENQRYLQTKAQKLNHLLVSEA